MTWLGSNAQVRDWSHRWSLGTSSAIIPAFPPLDGGRATGEIPPALRRLEIIRPGPRTFSFLGETLQIGRTFEAFLAAQHAGFASRG